MPRVQQRIFSRHAQRNSCQGVSSLSLDIWGHRCLVGCGSGKAATREYTGECDCRCCAFSSPGLVSGVTDPDSVSRAGLYGVSNLHIAPLDLGSSANGNGQSLGPVSSSVDSEATFSDALLGSSAPSPSTVLPIHHPQQVPSLHFSCQHRSWDLEGCI